MNDAERLGESLPIVTADNGVSQTSPRPHLVLAFTGPLGSGVSTMTRLLEGLGFHRVSISDAIKEEYRRRKNDAGCVAFNEKANPGWRQSLQDLGDEGRKEHLDYWVQQALKGVASDRELVIDGIRNLGEIEALRTIYPNLYVVAILASFQTRWHRVEENYDKNRQAFERDDRRDSDDELSYGQQVEKCVQAADYVLWNEKELKPENVRSKELTDRFKPEIALMRGEQIRYPTDAETYITSAYATSHSSRCLKRYVGAVIVSDRGIPLSVGFNENPVGMLPCEAAYHYCFKDADMDAKLEAMGPVHCPHCGTQAQKLAAPWTCSNCNLSLKRQFFPSRNMELCTAIHAEERAIRSLGDRSAVGATMYVTTFPCFQCSRYIADAEIARVVYVEAYPVRESEDFLLERGIVVEPFEGFKARAFNRIFRQRA